MTEMHVVISVNVTQNIEGHLSDKLFKVVKVRNIVMSSDTFT